MIRTHHMSVQEIEDLFSDMDRSDYEAVMVGSNVEVSNFSSLRTAKLAAVHCVLNGPVGVGKRTTFPCVEGEVRLKDLYEGRLSNKMWRNFCRIVAERIVRKYNDLAISSQQMLLNGNVWPLNEDEDDD